MPLLALLAAAAASAPAPGALPAFQPGVLLQTWAAGGQASLPHAALRLRRLELQGRGDLGALRYTVMADPGQAVETFPLDGTAHRTWLKPNLEPAMLLRDLNATLRTPFADVLVGQARIPVSLEGNTSSAALLLPERAAAATEFGDKRDLGIQVSRGSGPLRATAGLFARRTIADLATARPTATPPRDAALRVDLTPRSGLQLGAVAYGSVIGRGLAGTRDIVELDVRWEPGPLVLQAELFEGRDRDAGGIFRRSRGAYAAAGYRLTEPIQPVLRIGYLDRDLDGVTGTPRPVTQLDLGLNVITPLPGTRVQLAYSLTQGATLVAQYRY